MSKHQIISEQEDGVMKNSQYAVQNTAVKDNDASEALTKVVESLPDEYNELTENDYFEALEIERVYAALVNTEKGPEHLIYLNDGSMSDQGKAEGKLAYDTEDHGDHNTEKFAPDADEDDISMSDNVLNSSQVSELHGAHSPTDHTIVNGITKVLPYQGRTRIT
ncbi:hypothetical protein EV424DRAFT_1345477 [Suillus variegatus]|nr:hypothetical protein EV424DRAFT_1345477 [Suillus variegatus]